MKKSLCLHHVVKRFGDIIAVDDLTFAVEQGEVFGFLGGNGAGKTSSLRMVLDIIRPDTGVIEVLGCPPGREANLKLGFLPEERGLYRSMTALDTVVYFGRLKGMTARDARSGGRDLLDRFGLGANLTTAVEKLSKGMAQKVQLATAIINSPELLILDEPFSGLDPVNQGLLEGEIVAAARGGAAVIFSTHVMQHAERLCDRLLLLAKGRKLFEGTQAEARSTMPPRLEVVARASPAKLDGVEQVMSRGAVGEGWTAWDVRLAPGREPHDLLQQCTETGFALRRFEQNRPGLHDVFLHIVGSLEAQS